MLSKRTKLSLWFIDRNRITNSRNSFPNDASFSIDGGLLAGGVAQWLGRQPLAGGLYLIYAWSMVDMWPLCG